jgi:hypothetical protein
MQKHARSKCLFSPLLRAGFRISYQPFHSHRALARCQVGNRSANRFNGFLVWAADVTPTQSTTSVFSSAEAETVKTVSRFLTSFDTGLKPGVNEMSQFLTFGAKPLAPDSKTVA